jgi:hypothetical protein
MTKAEEIYHRFVNYEWNEIGEGMKVSIMKAIDEALKEGQKLPIHSVSNSADYTKGYRDGWRDCCKDAKDFG